MFEKGHTPWSKGKKLGRYSKERVRNMSIGRKGKGTDFRPSKEHIEAIRKSKLGENNPNWIGDKIGKAPLHGWIRRRKPKPQLCECCKTNKPYDLANISQKYKRDINDFEWLCRKCHMTKDGRLKMLIKIARNKTIETRIKISNSLKNKMNKHKHEWDLKDYTSSDGGECYHVCVKCNKRATNEEEKNISL